MLTCAQLTDLEAFWIHENGWGDYKQDHHFGQLACLFANANRDTKKKPKPYDPDDFTLRPKHKAIESPKDVSKKVRAAFGSLARIKPGKPKRKKKAK